MRDELEGRRGAWMRGRRRLAALVMVASLGLGALTLAGCDAGASASVSTAPTSTGKVGTAPAGTASVTATDAPTATPLTGQKAAGVAGAASVCRQQVAVSATVPASIPAYPGADLRQAQAQNGTGVYGYCATASSADIAGFYAAQLPAKGWQDLTHNQNNGQEQYLATQGNVHIVLTITPDSVNPGQTNILIVATGV